MDGLFVLNGSTNAPTKAIAVPDYFQGSISR